MTEYENREPECRFVKVTFAAPGSKSITETYDRLSLGDCTCWSANTMPPAMQFSAVPVADGPMISTIEEFELLAVVSEQSREAAKKMRKVKL